MKSEKEKKKKELLFLSSFPTLFTVFLLSSPPSVCVVWFVRPLQFSPDLESMQRGGPSGGRKGGWQLEEGELAGAEERGYDPWARRQPSARKQTRRPQASVHVCVCEHIYM